MAVESAGHPVAFKRVSNGSPGSSYVEGGGELLLETIFFEHYLLRVNVFRTHNGPVGESMIAARKSGRDAGNRIWASTLPAPAD